jgi:phage terminase large subunit-like protein
LSELITKQWIRNKSDEMAVENGSFFDLSCGAFTVWWIERYCKLYEGEWAGKPLTLRSGCEHLFDFEYPIMQPWEEGGEELSIRRSEIYSQWIADGNTPDWQYECTMRMFGWQKFSETWKRNIRRFREASIWVPKKQKKSPTLGAWGVFLTCGDSEPGQKCFACAKDGTQAAISMDHAIAMIEQSPELMLECKTHKNEKSIYHIPTRSKYKPLSSSGESNKNAKEGINGSILVDETHVVDRDFINIISRAGISRSEPYRIEVSTAGNNPDGYGKERQDYARLVQSGTEQNDGLFVAIYEAPQSLTDSELAKDPVKYGKMANPAWGHTAHEEEFLADYNNSKRSISELSRFKMYRLNIWSNTANQWLRMDEWNDCGSEEKLEVESFHGRKASIGMDLSLTRDMSALVCSIPIDDKICYLTPRMWITQEYADRNKELVDFYQWQRSNELTIVDGDTIKPQLIRDEFTRLVELLDVCVFVYDKTYASEFVDWVEEKYPKIIQIDYPQQSAAMEKPIDDFEAAVREKRLLHDGNRCLTWQAGHCSVHENFKGHRILKKPKRNDYRKIDGMVASVMAYWGTKHLPKRSSVYRRRGVLTA